MWDAKKNDARDAIKRSVRFAMSVFGLEFVLREGQAIEEFAGTDGTGLDDV